MALRYLQIDDATGKKKSPASLFVDVEFDVGVGGQTQFILGVTITATTKLDVLVNGVKRREGATNTWQRNITPARVDFNETIPQNAWVLVRIWS